MQKKAKPRNYPISPIQYEVISDFVTPEARKEIAAKFGVSREYVRLILLGERPHEEIFKMALKKAAKEKKRVEKRNKEALEQLSNLLS